MNKLHINSGKVVFSVVSKSGTKLVQLSGLYTSMVGNLDFSDFKPTDFAVINNLYTGLVHRLFSKFNSLSSGFIHALNTHYYYYELNTLNTKKELKKCN